MFFKPPKRGGGGDRENRVRARGRVFPIFFLPSIARTLRRGRRENKGGMAREREGHETTVVAVVTRSFFLYSM